MWTVTKDSIIVPKYSSCPSEAAEIHRKIDYIISRTTAESIFTRYVCVLSPQCPVVVFSADTTAAEIRENKPALFLCILSVASSAVCTVAEQKELTSKARELIAERVACRGEKSLELIQALQVSSLWYRAPEHYRQVNLYQLVQMATTMAMDVGLDRMDRWTGSTLLELAEAQRAWLGCFLLSARLVPLFAPKLPVEQLT